MLLKLASYGSYGAIKGPINEIKVMKIIKGEVFLLMHHHQQFAIVLLRIILLVNLGEESTWIIPQLLLIPVLSEIIFQREVAVYLLRMERQ